MIVYTNLAAPEVVNMNKIQKLEEVGMSADTNSYQIKCLKILAI
ncbi:MULTISPECIES: hypothetical protein [unclassified Nostoc]|nr:hypothetical protein [Nostoc sp. 'Peltigera membranacea cyanobiont' 213]